MTIESTYDYIDDLNASYPEGASLVSEADDHIRGIKAVLKNQFPNLGDAAVTKTAAELNAVLTTAGGGVTGLVTFNDEASGFEWDLSGSSPTWAQTVSFTAFTLADPYVAGNPTVAGLSLNAPIVQVNNPVLPGVTSGFQIYYNDDDAAPVAGFQFLEGNSDANAGGLSVYQNAGGNTDFVYAALLGSAYFRDTVAQGGLYVSLDNLVGHTENLATIVSTYGSILDYVAALEARIAALEA